MKLALQIAAGVVVGAACAFALITGLLIAFG